MKNYAILTDSSSDLNADLLARFEIDDYIRGVMSTPDGENIECSLDAMPDEYFDTFYKKLKSNPKAYKTAACGLGKSKEIMKKYLDKGLDILLVCVSTALSGIYKIVMQARSELLEEYKDRKIFILDSRRYSLGIGMLAIRAAEHRKEGLSIEENYKLLEEERDTLHHIGPVDDLFYVASKGRISNAKAFFGTVFGIKPLGDFGPEGMVTVLGKVNGVDKACRAMIEYMKKTIKNPKDQIIFCPQASRRKEATKLKEMIIKEFNPKEVIVTNIYPNTAINSGPGLFLALYFGTKITDLKYERETLNSIISKL